MTDVVFGVDTLFAIPTVGHQRAIYSGRIVKACDIVPFGIECGIGRLVVMAHEHGRSIHVVWLEHLPSLISHRPIFDLRIAGENQIAAYLAVAHGFPPACPEMFPSDSRMINEVVRLRQRNFDTF